MAQVKWIKLTTNMFEDEKIDFIESLPEADAILIVWIKLLTLAGKCNTNGFIFLTENIPYTPEMLAHRFRRPLNTVKLALDTLNKLDMIQFDEGGFLKITNWEKHQNIEGMEKIREQTRKRVARHREKQKLLDSNVTHNVTVTQGNATDKDIDKEDIYIPYREIVSYLNQKAGTSYKPSTKKTQTLIKARINEGFILDDFRKVIDIKAGEWLGTDMQKYLRPETLFGTKFEGYLNQKSAEKEPEQPYFKPLNYEYED